MNETKSNSFKYSFIPKINKNSKQIALKYKQQGQKVYDRLIKEGEGKTEEISLLDKKYAPKYEFTPEINNNIPINTSFQSRQESLIKKRLNHSISTMNIEKSQAKSRTEDDELRFIEYMQGYANKYKSNYIRAIKEKKQKEEEDYNTKFITEETEELFNSMLQTKFESLFDLLDSDEDGVISFVYMNTRKVSEKVLKLINPILNQVKENKDSLKRHEFIQILFNYYTSLNYCYKRELLLNISEVKPFARSHSVCAVQQKAEKRC